MTVSSDKHNYIAWKTIDEMFSSNEHHLVDHHISSYDDFFIHKMKNIFQDNNPVNIFKNYDEDLKEYKLQARLYFGGKLCDKIYFDKPVMYDEHTDETRLIFPNEARLKSKTYGFNIYYDVEVEIKILTDDKNFENVSFPLEKICLGKFPIMLQSKLCLLNSLPPLTRYNLGECKNDKGGYFIIDGNEKVIVCQEQFANNSLYIKNDYNDTYSINAEIRSVSDDTSKPVRVTAVKMVRPSTTYSNNNIVVSIPNVRKPIPLFIVFRALGIVKDHEILEHILLDIDANSPYVDVLQASIHDASVIFNQNFAIKYISSFTKYKSIESVMNILSNYFLPHLGETCFHEKALFLGHMVFKMLKVYMNVDAPTDRDSFMYKRVETPGSLLYNLFREYYQQMVKNIHTRFDKEYYYKDNSNLYDGLNFPNLFKVKYREFFIDEGFYVQNGFNKAFKGQWGSKVYTSKEGIVQDLNRLSFNSALSHCRKVNLPIDSTAKVVAPRLLHSSQWGYIDPVDTPDGGHIGLHKHLAISCKISFGVPTRDMVTWLKDRDLLNLSEVSLKECSYYTKIFVNGAWVGLYKDPMALLKEFNIYKKSGLIPLLATISFNHKDNIMTILCDSGRVTRPIYYVDKGKISYEKHIKNISEGKMSWVQMVSGTIERKVTGVNLTKIYEIHDIYEKDVTIERLENNMAFIEYVDNNVENTSYISINDFENSGEYTHFEIHPSLILGVMGNQIIYPNQNPVSRDLFSCGQSKQAVSRYSSNYHLRYDKTGLVLNYGQMPLVRSKYLKYISNEEHPYGENVIVAIMSCNGYNVEDSILFNEASIARGLFRTTYYSTYKDHEEIGKNDTKNIFSNIEQITEIDNLPIGYEFHHLDDDGMVKENTEINDKVVIMGKITASNGEVMNQSIKPKKGQIGMVDKVYLSNDVIGHRTAKVRIREERIPRIGDKFCSRCGQKGTIGLIIPEENMPFNENGLRPDIIINPHAIPSRMTIGQLIETITGKACIQNGSFANCTAFEETNLTEYSEVLSQHGFHSQGNEVLYDGMTGNQIETDVFIGPTYYMRLKHMVKDKINHRASGPKNNLTRQTVQGRANDGGLRIGEMERDALISHGIVHFLRNSLVERGDKYYLAVCNHSGTIAIHNKRQNVFFSPYVDGPLVFNSIDSDKNTLEDHDFATYLERLGNVSYVSQFGKNFSIVEVPYALKLLIQELSTMNVQMRIITADNIETMTTKTKQNITMPIEKLLPIDEEGVEEFKAGDVDVDDMEIDENYENSRIVKHTIFNVDDHVIYNKTGNQIWVIKKIDHAKPDQDNVTIATNVSEETIHNIPEGSVIEEARDKTSNTTMRFVTLNVSINDISKPEVSNISKPSPDNLVGVSDEIQETQPIDKGVENNEANVKQSYAGEGAKEEQQEQQQEQQQEETNMDTLGPEDKSSDSENNQTLKRVNITL
tara:strand:+ start:776 stop:5107 length:4332 start_codon:yes stop_codon:yes gene_type:complete